MSNAPHTQCQPEADALRQHTPTPWFVSGVRYRMNGGEWQNINRYDASKKQDENIACVSYDPRTGLGLADAHFIVEAVNSHATLQARVDELTADLDTMTEGYAASSRAIGRRGTEEESLADQITSLVRRAEELTKALEWQPIETAPHEERVLLGWDQQGTWFCETGMASHGWRRGSYSTMSRHGYATHWMPLPGSPVVPLERSGGAT